MSTATLAQRTQEKLMDQIKELRKLKENRKCFECQSKQPACVDMTHNTFVCMTCGGILRMFNCRVKSISISSFTSSEVEALSAGGNKVAKKKWLAGFTGEYPTSGNTEQIKDFVRKKYEEQTWTKKSGASKRQSKRRGSKKEVVKEDDNDDDDDDAEEGGSEAEVPVKAERRKSTKAERKATKESPKQPDLLDLSAMFSTAAAVSQAPAPAATGSDWSFGAQPPAPAAAHPPWGQSAAPVFTTPAPVTPQAPFPNADPFADLLASGANTASAQQDMFFKPESSPFDASNPFATPMSPKPVQVVPFGAAPSLSRPTSLDMRSTASNNAPQAGDPFGTAPAVSQHSSFDTFSAPASFYGSSPFGAANPQPVQQQPFGTPAGYSQQIAFASQPFGQPAQPMYAATPQQAAPFGAPPLQQAQQSFQQPFGAPLAPQYAQQPQTAPAQQGFPAYGENPSSRHTSVDLSNPFM